MKKLFKWHFLTFISNISNKMSQKKEIRITESKFIRVRCPKCENEQVIFGKSSTKIKCLKCEKILTEPTGGKAKIRCRVLEVLN